MNAARIQVLLSLMIVYGWSAGSLRAEQQTVKTQELPVVGEDVQNPDAALDTQLRVYKSALLEGKTDKIRLDAATLLLLSEDPAAREIVLDVLRRSDNPLARAAVCDALTPVRVGQKVLKNKEDFIKPLLFILTSEGDPEIVKRAAEAILLFAYDQVQQDLEQAVTDPSLSITVRLNVIYALKRQPAKAAVAKLISLLDSSEPQIVEAVRTALVSIGITVGPDQTTRQRIADLMARSPEAFLCERVIRQETRLREQEAEVLAGQNRYLTALNGWHDSLTSETLKYEFLTRQLTSPEIIVRSWALDRLQELRKAKGTLKLPELEPTLLRLIGDPSRQVRLGTARLLARMGELNAAKSLLDQLKVEQDDQVRREILVALREACYVGSLATTGHKVPDDVRKETLEWALRFLGEADAEKVRSGAEALGKLLEQDGLKPEEVTRYLTALLDRYTQAGPTADPGMRGSLLGSMAGLCATRSTCRDQAVKLYGGSFEQAITDKAPIVRQNAVDGLVNIDKSVALRKLRENMTTDPSVPIRLKLVDLAGEVGGPQDLEWLAEKLGVVGEGEPAWIAMLKIFRSPRADSAVLAGWTVKIEALAKAGKLTAEQSIAFFALVESKALSENQADLLKDVRTRLALLYESSSNPKLASEYLKVLLGTVVAPEERQRVEAQLVRVYLEMASMDQAAELIAKCLSDKNLDLSTNGVLIKSIEEYLNNPATTNPGVVLEALQRVNVKEPGTLQAWRDWLGRWSERFAKAKKIEDSGRASN